MIDLDDWATLVALRDLKAVRLKLLLMPHTSAAAVDPTSPATDQDIGGKCPPGGLDRKGDRAPDYRQKSSQYFGERLGHMIDSKAPYEAADVTRLVEEAYAALESWRRSPVVLSDGLGPERGSFYWKCQIADDPREVEEIKQAYTVSRATVYRYRLKYRGIRSVRVVR